MGAEEYRLLQGRDSSEGELSLPVSSPTLILQWKTSFTKFVVLTLLFSLMINGFAAFHFIQLQSSERCLGVSPYAGLESDLPLAWTHSSDFVSQNRSVQDDAWKSMDEDVGVVALSDDIAARTGLPIAQRWPWHASKGIYLLHGYHNLHCLNILRSSLFEMHDSVPQSLHFSHITHCLDALRQDIICNADDTPRYTGLEFASGNGQVRMCRDWAKLERWANEHSACYRYNASAKYNNGVALSQFKFCPDGSRPWE